MEPTKLDEKWEIFHVLGIRWETVRELNEEEIEFLYAKAVSIRRQIVLSQQQKLDGINDNK
jgi:hypothetical protein